MNLIHYRLKHLLMCMDLNQFCRLYGYICLIKRAFVEDIGVEPMTPSLQS